MIISGKQLAENILEQLRNELPTFFSKNIIPKIAIVTLGSQNSWGMYVRQKLKVAEKLNIHSEHISLNEGDEEGLLKLIDKLNNDPNVQGFIIQRPFGKEIDKEKVINAVSEYKDIDGFKLDSKFGNPIWLAVKTVLEEAFILSRVEGDFKNWLAGKNIVIIGKGETGGRPTREGLEKLGITPNVIDSKTEPAKREDLLKNADVVITAVGKKRVVTGKDLKKGVILIGIGIHSNEEGKTRGDYVEEDIDKVANYYTTTPGGIGPLNLAYLFQNLIKAAKIQIRTS